jgi:hypothetical protein
MDAYKVQQTVKNGQLIIDLPPEFDNTLVEAIVLQVAQKAASDEIPKSLTPYTTTLESNQEAAESAVMAYGKPKLQEKEDLELNELDESDFILPRKKVDISKLRGSISNESTELWEQYIEDTYESDFWLPRQKIDLKQFRGALKLDISTDEIDSLTKSWRDEWSRDLF